MSRTFDFTFKLRKPKDYVKGPVRIFLTITVDSKRCETSTAQFADPGQWDSKTGRMKGRSEEAKSVNAYLDILQNELYQAHSYLLQNNIPITAEGLRNFYTGKGERQRYLVEIFKEHNENLEKLIGLDYTKPTHVKYTTSLNHVEEFLVWKYNISDVALSQLNYEFLSDFEFYLKTEKSIGHNTTAKYIKNTKKIVNDCISKGWLKSDPFANFKITPKLVDRIFLSEEELELLSNKEFKIQRLAQVRDIFLFSCYTGLSFIDVFNLTPNHLAMGIDREKWIFTSRQKSGIASHIPLLPPAIEIIEKYKDHPAAVNKGKLLPILSNQKMNAYLKEIADLCGIDKEFTFHTARHTFATTVTLTNDVPIESVSKMLGHKKLQTTQHYAKILDKKVSNDMKNLRQKFDNKSQEAIVEKIAN